MIRFSNLQVIILHDDLINKTGGETGLRDKKLLDLALMNPFQSFGGTDLYPTIMSKAARLCYGIVKNHPFIDGNKRTAAHVMLMFLHFNNIELEYTQKELSDIILSVAAGETDFGDLSDWIISHEKP